MVTIRLARHGSKKHPFYHVTVAERSSGRDGRFVERIGFYNPVARGAEEKLRLDVERADYWISVGARPSDKVSKLLAQARGNVGAPAAAAQ
jgi:small subunit ribosomal protein S16